MLKIKVSKQVLEGITVVRDSGKTNMFHLPNVVLLAKIYGYPEAAEWVDEHPREYATGVIYGFEEEAEEVDVHE